MEIPWNWFDSRWKLILQLYVVQLFNVNYQSIYAGELFITMFPSKNRKDDEHNAL